MADKLFCKKYWSLPSDIISLAIIRERIDENAEMERNTQIVTMKL